MEPRFKILTMCVYRGCGVYKKVMKLDGGVHEKGRRGLRSWGKRNGRT